MLPADDRNRVTALFTDLYQLTMAQAYDAEQLDQTAVFELAFRTLPPNRNFALAAGLDDVLAALAQLCFGDDDLAYLRGLSLFSASFLERLASLRFTGDVNAVPEGTPVFPNEPIVQVIAPLVQAQIVETLLLNQIHFQTVAATKAARIVAAAAGRAVVDFGSRRAHGLDAAMKVARTSYIAGAAGTSLVAAGQKYGIPIFGTMAHSYIQAHRSEAEAFSAFVKLYPGTTILVDTYDTLEGVRRVVDLSSKLGDAFRVRAIRLDSGDLGQLTRQSRQILDAAGLNRVEIFASSELDEFEIAALLNDGAPIDGFGVGTKLAVSDDAPHLDMAYKLVEYTGQGRTKLSKKRLYPGQKQVFREIQNGRMVGDVIGRHNEGLPGRPLLVPVMRSGTPLAVRRRALEEIRNDTQRELSMLSPELHRLETVSAPYPVVFSQGLENNYAAFRQMQA
jgi:nicotinate phosphoribosyltransferase